MSEPRVIKRYANRKLYDTQRSRYVTLDQIADMIRAGQDVKIVDNNSKEDLTSITLAQIIFEQEKKQKAFMPLGAMKNIIQSGGASLHELASQAGARVRQVFARGEHGFVEGAGDEGVVGVVAETMEEAASPSAASPTFPTSPTLPTSVIYPVALVRELFERSQLTFEEWQKRVDERVQKVVEALAPWTVLQKEITELSGRIVELEKKLAESEHAPGNEGRPSDD